MAKKTRSTPEGSAAPVTMGAVLVPLSDLTEDPKNARRHPDKNLAEIRASLVRYGQREPLIRRHGVLLGGNGRLQAMRALVGSPAVDPRARGAKGVLAALLGALHRGEAWVTDHDDLSEAEALDLALRLNSSALSAEWDPEQLRLNVEAVRLDLPDVDLEELGVIADEIELPAEEPAEIEEDEPPEPLPEAKAQRGDIITLGRPYVWCPKCKKRHEL